MSRKRLVILGSSVTALAIARSAQSLEIKPIIVDVEHGVATLTAGCEIHVVSSRTDAAAFQRIIALAGPSSFLVATSDYWLEFVADHEDSLRTSFATVLHPNADVLHTCLNKAQFASWCRESEVPTPEFHTGEDISTGKRTDVTFPVILRPAATLHHQKAPAVPKAIEVHDSATLNQWLSVFWSHGVDAFLSESLLDRRLTQFSVGIARRGTAMSSLVTRKLRPFPEKCSVGTLVSTCVAPEVEALGRRVAEGLELQGIAEIEILHAHDTDSNYVVEVNPRPWVQYSLTRAAGRDFLHFLLREDNGPEKSGDGGRHCWLNFRSDLYNCFSRSEGLVRNRQIGLLTYIHSIAVCDTPAYFSIRDPRPAWAEMKATASMLFRR